MKIEIDLKLLEATGLSADDYCCLYLLWRKGFSWLEQIEFEPDWIKLEQIGYVKMNDHWIDCEVTEKFMELFNGDFDTMFAELIAAYPMKVQSPTRGIRVLHAKDPNSKSNLKARNKYKKIVNGKTHIHQHIMFLLKKQLMVEKENLGYLQNLETWINNHTWEKYEEIDIENAIRTDGQQRNTRLL